MSDGIQLRLASPDDADAIASVLHQAFREFQHLYTPEGFAATTPSPQQIHGRFHQGPVWIAKSDNRIVGTAAAMPEENVLYIRSVAVLPPYAGHGIGKLLLEQIEQFAKSAGYNQLLLTTTPFLTAAIHLYERVGFRHLEDGPRDLFGTPLLAMAKDLFPRSTLPPSAQAV